MTTSPTALFHLAFHVSDLDEAARFYVEVLGAQLGRRSDTWVDVTWYGHQLSMHLGQPMATTPTGQVDGQAVPMPHFGLVLRLDEWQRLRQRLEAQALPMVIAPHVRFVGEPGEQATLFLRDPFGNPIEIKGFADWDGVGAH